jgi:hypothetical protein
MTNFVIGVDQATERQEGSSCCGRGAVLSPCEVFLVQQLNPMVRQPLEDRQQVPFDRFPGLACMLMAGKHVAANRQLQFAGGPAAVRRPACARLAVVGPADRDREPRRVAKRR